MASLRSFLLSIAGASMVYATPKGYKWPDPKIDYLETILYQQQGYKFDSLASALSPNGCQGPFPGGRNLGAEWLRIAYHDMATADASTGRGGIDASITFESTRAENVGSAFDHAFKDIFRGPRGITSSMADIIAIAAVIATGMCSQGNVIVPFRGGRVEATGPEPSGVPEPQQDLNSHTTAFARQGFNATEMIGLVACGHTIGGVHGRDFPEIVPFDSNNPEDEQVQNFDGSTGRFDNNIARMFVANRSTNPLVTGPNVTTRSDLRIFNADNGQLVRRMANEPLFFFSTCNSLIERMLNTVPKEVTLTEVITPIAVKPGLVAATVNSNGTLSIEGEVRILEDGSSSEQRQIRIHFIPRSGVACSISQPCPVAVATTTSDMKSSSLYNPKIKSTHYSFSVEIPISQGVSAFTVEIEDGGNTVMETNGGSGFPFDDALLVQNSQTCGGFDSTGHFFYNHAIAVRDDFTDVSITWHDGVAQEGSTIDRQVSTTFQLSNPQPLEGLGYSLYASTYTTTTSFFRQNFQLKATNGTHVVEIFEHPNVSFCPDQ